MKHLDHPYTRLEALGGGHVAILNLLKRWRLVTTGLTPQSVEEGWTDSYAGLWAQLSKQATGAVLPMMTATDDDLWAMARSLVAGLAKHPTRADWYPTGWQAMAALVVAGKPKPAPRSKAVRASPPRDPRLQVLTTLDYVATELGIDEKEVLRRIERSRASLGAKDERKLLAFLEEELERGVGGGA